MRRRSGIILADVVLGLLIVAATGALLSTTISQHHKAAERLAGSRAAVRAAERVLSHLQLRQTPAASDHNLKWELRPLEAVAPSGHAWLEVRVVHRQRSASVTGIVPAPSVQGGVP